MEESVTPASLLLARCEATFAECLEIIRKKNHDYAADADAFANFRTCELLNVSAEKGIMVRWLDKIKRIDNLLTKEAYVTDESIEDTLRDAINYPALLLALIRDRRSREKR